MNRFNVTLSFSAKRMDDGVETLGCILTEGDVSIEKVVETEAALLEILSVKLKGSQNKLVQ